MNANAMQRVLRECYIKSLPVYVFVPMDFVNQQVPIDLLDSPIDTSPLSSESSVTSALDAVISILRSAKSPVIIVDALVARFQATHVARQLLDLLILPTFSTPMGKSIADESKPYYYGVYNGQVSLPGVVEQIEAKSDLVLELGPILSDSNTGGHSRNIKTKNQISIAPDHVKVGEEVYEEVYIVECAKTLASSFSLC